MDLDNGASLAISVQINGGCQIVFKSAEEEIVVDSPLNLTQLKSERDKWREDLNRIRTALGGANERSWPSVSKAMNDLHARGRFIVRRLLGDERCYVPNVVAMCRRALPSWSRTNWDANSLAPHIVEVRTNVDYGIPFDMLPLLDMRQPRDSITDYTELASVASSFLGFASIVRRSFGHVDAEERRLRMNNSSNLPMKVFWDAKLPAAERALAFFRDNAEHFDIKGGPWPTTTVSSKEDEFTELLADYLWRPESRLDGYDLGRPDEFCYFVCHCDTTAPHPEDYVLHLGTGAWIKGGRAVKLFKLEDKLRGRREASDATPSGPLIFLNACGAGDLDPFSATSFSKLFTAQQLGFLGFIGPEVTVPDWFASQFAEALYRHFVGGLTLGRALHSARWHMLRRFRHPFGLMYTLYADPEIQTRHKVPALRDSIAPRPQHSEGPEPQYRGKWSWLGQG